MMIAADIAQPNGQKNMRGTERVAKKEVSEA